MLRVAQVGYGWFGAIHAQVWSQMDGVKLVAVCDRDPSAFQGTAGRVQDDFHRNVGTKQRFTLPREVRCYSDMADMMSREQIDLVDVVVPESVHYEVALAALTQRYSVLVEKPLVLRKADARTLAAKARDVGRHLYVGHILRFDPRYRSCAERISKDRASLRTISLKRHFQPGALSVYGRVHPFFAACIHDIDIAIWFVGKPPDRVFATSKRFLHGDHDDAVAGFLEWTDGPLATLENSWHLAKGFPYGFSFETTVMTEIATYVIRDVPVVEVTHSVGGVEAPEHFFWPELDGRRVGAIQSELRHFADCAEANRASAMVPVSDAIASVAVAEALLASTRSRQWEPVTT